MIRVRVIISGNVQGVGFRMFVFRKARELGVTGWVKNMFSGQIEAVLEGEEVAVDKLVEECQRGPILSKVHQTQVIPETPTGRFREFEIRM